LAGLEKKGFQNHLSVSRPFVRPSPRNMAQTTRRISMKFRKVNLHYTMCSYFKRGVPKVKDKVAPVLN